MIKIPHPVAESNPPEHCRSDRACPKLFASPLQGSSTGEPTVDRATRQVDHHSQAVSSHDEHVQMSRSTGESPKTSYRLAALHSHPIQYFAPLYRGLGQDPSIDLIVFFCSRQGVDQYRDEGFGQAFQWDVPLLERYEHRFLSNFRKRDRVAGFFSLMNFGLVRELRTNCYDAILVPGHMYFSYLLAIAWAKVLRIPVFMRAETHLGLRRSKVKRLLRGPLLRFFYNHLCDRCLPIGTRSREFYLAHGVPPERLFDVPYTVDNARFIHAAGRLRAHVLETRTALGLPTDRPVLLFVAKLVDGKRPQDLLAAFHRLRERGIKASLVFVGSGPLERTLQGQIAAHRIPDVYLMGFRNQSELPKFYAAADMLVFPSESETWGLVINEAMCAGLPIIASEEIGAVPDLVKHGHNGLTYPAGDIDQLTAYLESLVTDESLRQQMGENSLAIIRSWSLERCVEGVLAALCSLDHEERDRR